MKRLILSAIVLLCCVLAAEDVKPVVDAPEGKRAFHELTAFYGDSKQDTTYMAALADLKSQDAAKRKSAGIYLMALMKQLFADEFNGRGPYQKTPFFGGGNINVARDYRTKVAKAFGEQADGAEALDAALWLVNDEMQAVNQAAGMATLRRIKVPRSTEIFKSLLAGPHPNAEVTKGVIEEVGARKLNALGQDVFKLVNHYRPAVREAARKVGPELIQNQVAQIPEYKPENAITPWLEQQFKNIAAMVMVDIPKDAQFKRVKVTGKNGAGEFSAFLIDQKDGKLHLVDTFGSEMFIDAKEATMTPRKLSDEAADLLAARAGGGGGGREGDNVLSKRGGLTRQFEPKFVSVPEGLVAAWSFLRGDKATAAQVILPRIEQTADDRWVVWAVRDMIGKDYNNEMLTAFSHERDYAKTIAIAKHLSKPCFADYNYQERAKTLAAQLEKRTEDFKTFTLPTAEQWEKQKKDLSREKQIAFLAEHLRLLNCIQMGQPGDVNYADEQSAKPGHESGKVINPYNELRNMKLEIGEVGALAPFLADDNFMPTFSYWRDFHPTRTLHQVNWAVAGVINDVAHRDLAALKTYNGLDAAGKKDHIQKIVDWSKSNAGKSRDQLQLESLASAQDWREFARSAGEAVQQKNAKAFPIISRRKADFPKNGGDIAEFAYHLETPEAIPEARKWLNDQDQVVRFYAALILIHNSPKNAKPEGLDHLTELLAARDVKGSGSRFNAGEFYPEAIDELLATKFEAAMQLAAGVLKNPEIQRGFSAGPILQRLILAGRQEAFDYLTNALGDETGRGQSSGSYKGQNVQRQQTNGDNAASMISQWRTDGVRYETMAPDEERKAEREKLKGWLKTQFDLIKAGKPSAINPKVDPLRRARWQIDAP